jgi:uncharacterized repeat protein (TIGR03806 family)
VTQCARFALLVILLFITAGCRQNTGVDPHLDRAYPDKLSEWRLFTGAPPGLQPNTGVVAYEVNTPLFSDYALKRRTVWMPARSSAQYTAKGALTFPVGTILSKTFSFPQRDGSERLVETRLIVRQASGWIALEYVWNAQQTEAVLDTAPLPVRVKWADESGEHTTDYSIPNVNQCSVCHDGGSEGTVPLGVTARNLNRTVAYPAGTANQLAHWTEIGYLKGAPVATAAPRLSVWDDPSTGSLDERARAYLDVNCATCHRPGTRAGKSGLYLGLPQEGGTHVGFCQASDIVRRMDSLDPEKGMPNLGHDVVHREGLALIREWAASMPSETCPGRI